MTQRPAALIAIGVGFAALLAAAAIGSALYRGSGPAFVFFNASFLALVALVFPRPRAYVYTFFAVFLSLGFWFKVLFHALAAPAFVEPVGDFAHTPHEWDLALTAAACGALGLAAARAAQLGWSRRRAGARNDVAEPPPWFLRWRTALWLLTIVLVVAVNAANLHFSFYQIGVRPRLLLPFAGHVVLGWLVNIGLALWVATLLWWDYRLRGVLGRNLLLPLAEALLSATSAFSRMNFLIHAVPYALVMAERRNELGAAIRRRSLYLLLAAALVLFVASVLAVFWLRVYQYYGYAADAPGNEPLAQHVERTIYKQVPLLLVHRWVGLEGVLVVGAAPRSPARLAEALVESPKLGGQSMFQRAAKTGYLSEKPDEFVFLANAGPVAVLWFSGSLALVFAGMALIGLVLIGTEAAASRWTGNPFALAVAGAALANVVSQTSFFYLTLVFLLQLWLALASLGCLQRLKLGNPQRGK